MRDLPLWKDDPALSVVPGVSGARGKDENWRPLPRRVGLANAEGDLLCYWVGVWVTHSRQRFLEYLGVNGTHF